MMCKDILRMGGRRAVAEVTPAQLVRAVPAPRAPVPIWAHRVGGLPSLPPLIGRERELAALCELVSRPERRLITVTGPGGVGKTRLALAAAVTGEAAFADGSVFVPLAAINGPALVLPTIAQALDTREIAERPLRDVLIATLRERHLLLVLDNFEHVLGAAADVLALLEGCPRLTVLATSRAPLGLHDEQRFGAPPLALPGVTDALPPDALTAYGAISLFVERARFVNVDFALNDQNAAAVVEICRRLDGLPLAIELAAAWVRVLSPVAILSRLEPRLPLLRGGPSDQPVRLRTMRDAVTWSHDLLSDEEQRLFRRLAVFAGGFTLEAAEIVGGGSLDLVAALIDKSLLLQMSRHRAEPRFTMLETVREFALERLAEHGEVEAIEAGRAAYVLALAEQADPELMGTEQSLWFDRLEAEQQNMQAALAWFHRQGDGERGLRLASALTWFWSSRSQFRESRTWLERFLEMPTPAPTRGRGLGDAANILHWQGETERATVYATEALAIVRAIGDQNLVMCALRRLGSIAIDQGDFDRAATKLAECQELLPTAGTPWDLAFAPYLSGRLAAAAGRPEEAIEAFAEAAEAFRAINDRGYVAAARGQQGAALLAMDDLDAARAAYAESLELACAVKDQASLAWALIGSAHLAHAAGEPATAARILGAAVALREAIGERRLPQTALTSALQSSLGAERFASEWSRGTRAQDAEVITEARAILSGADSVRRGHSGYRLADETTLTPRERDVLRLLAEGGTDKEIGAALKLSRRTVSNHVGAILTKLGVESRTAAVSGALRRGLL
jgi:predicted ATPase/DNA-binding CsgD family transcriptional regulator/predicted negative regulator of RcsB-dependent stress response